MSKSGQPPRPHNRRTVIPATIAIPLLIVIRAGLGYLGLRKVLESEQARILDLSGQIAVFELPEGFRATGGSSSHGIIFVEFADHQQDSIILMVQQSPFESVNFLENSVFPQRGTSITWATVDTRPFNVRGQSTTVMILYSIGPQGEEYHAWSASFAGKGGPALVIAAWHDEAWDPRSAESFIAGLH